MTHHRSLSLLIVALLAGTLFLSWQAGGTTAQNTVEESSTANLIAELWDRVLVEQRSDSDSDFEFTIEFIESISGVGNSVTLGQGMTTLRIDRVGLDYVCFSRLFSQTIASDCVPIHNIAKVTFRDAR